MKLILVSAFFKPHMGGAERYTENLARVLVRLGNDVIVLTTFQQGTSSVEEDPDGYTIIRIKSRLLMNGRFPLVVRNQETKKTMDELVSWHTDAVVINTRFYPLSLFGSLVAKRSGVVPVIIDHGSAYLTINNPIIDRILIAYEHGITRLLRRNPADFYGVSQASVEWLRTFGINAKGVLSNSIDADVFSRLGESRSFRSELNIDDKKLVIVFAGRLVPEKGISQIMEAASRLISNTNIIFLLAGEGPLEEPIREKKLPNIHLLGRLDTESLAALMNEGDVLLMPTRSEGFSTTLLEAAACATVPVITNVGGVAELIPNDSYGIVLEDRDPKTICDSIIYLYENPEIRNAMAYRIQQHVIDGYSWKKTATSLIEACEAAQN